MQLAVVGQIDAVALQKLSVNRVPQLFEAVPHDSQTLVPVGNTWTRQVDHASHAELVVEHDVVERVVAVADNWINVQGRQALNRLPYRVGRLASPCFVEIALVDEASIEPALGLGQALSMVGPERARCHGHRVELFQRTAKRQGDPSRLVGPTGQPLPRHETRHGRGQQPCLPG